MKIAVLFIAVIGISLSASQSFAQSAARSLTPPEQLLKLERGAALTKICVDKVNTLSNDDALIIYKYLGNQIYVKDKATEKQAWSEAYTSAYQFLEQNTVGFNPTYTRVICSATLGDLLTEARASAPPSTPAVPPSPLNQ